MILAQHIATNLLGFPTNLLPWLQSLKVHGAGTTKIYHGAAVQVLKGLMGATSDLETLMRKVSMFSRKYF